MSPGNKFLMKPDFVVIYLSLALLPQPSDIKLTEPCGVIPIRYFAVLWCL